MSSALSRSHEDLYCPICHKIFIDPVVLSCSHSFCKDCLHQSWKGKPVRLCPVCKRKSSKSEPPSYFALKKRCETFLQEREQKLSDPVCHQHSQRLSLFCLVDQIPICVICQTSRFHKKHDVSPVDEAAQDHREELQRSVRRLKERKRTFEQVKVTLDHTVGHIRTQAQNTARQIKEQFRKLHQFLQEEEESRIRVLREEEEQKTQRMKVKMEVLSKEIRYLSETIQATEDELKAEDIAFLHKYKATVERVQQCPPMEAPQLGPGALIDQAKHLGNLSFNIWNKMKDMVSYSPVVLDPNSAHPDLVLSEDLSRVCHRDKQNVPDNPERNDYFTSVLASTGFNSGSHSWDVDVTGNTVWLVGVVNESIQRKGDQVSGLWRIGYYGGKYTARSTWDPETVLLVRKKLRKVRVQLDFYGGKLTFFDRDSNTHIHTFTHTFTERVFPFINTKNDQSLGILPGQISVTVKEVR
uniref:Zinc-binding protein A33-like n=1 Tax=Sphaeramia orbicularis TaxID=375764 RepID=A0A672ZE92_9TELE